MIGSLKYKYLLFLVAFSYSCNSSKITDTKKEEINSELILAKERVPGITMEQLKHGSKLYIRNCSACHALHSPAQYTVEQWQPILVKMFPKAKIRDSATKILIINYLAAKSK